MNLEDFKSLDKVIDEIKKLELVNWKIINVNLSYVSSGEINIKLQKINKNNSPQQPEGAAEVVEIPSPSEDAKK